MTRKNITNSLLFFAMILVSGFDVIYGRVMVNPRSNLKSSQIEGADSRVFQQGATNSSILTNSTSTAMLLASGHPAGILNSGGTTTSFSGSSVMTQDLPSNTSSNVGDSLSAHCAGGQLGTFLAGQQNIALHSIANCSNFVDSK